MTPVDPLADPSEDPELQRKIFLARRLGPRLAWLHALPSLELRELKRSEDEQLRALETDIRAAIRDFSHPQLAVTAERRFRALWKRVFAPMTTGVHFPDDALDAPDWNQNFDESDGPYISGFIATDIGARDLEQMGVVVRCQVNDIFTVLVRMSALDGLADSGLIRSIEIASAYSPHLHQAIPYAKIDVLQSAHDGAGIVVGVIDDGLDLRHPDFQKEMLGVVSTRILWLWDQTLTATGSEVPPPTAPALNGFQYKKGSSYGVEYSEANISAWLRDPTAPPVRHVAAYHGTVVTGCAAGNGRLYDGLVAKADPVLAEPNCPGSAPRGAAPGADIIFVAQRGVAGTRLLANSSAVIDAFKYIFARAGSQPCVVNLSYGDNQGGHDGRSFGERTLDDLLAPYFGRGITLSAGNTYLTNSHVADEIPAGASKSIRLYYLDGAENADAIEVWYPAGDELTAQLTVLVPNYVDPGKTTWLDVSLDSSDHQVKDVGNTRVVLDSTIGVPDNGDNRIKIMISPIPPASASTGWNIQTGDWVLTLTAKTAPSGKVAFHAWVDRNNRGYSSFRDQDADDALCTIEVPATAELPIAVGAHMKDGPPPTVPMEYESSSRGPSRVPIAGVPKPDLATVGYHTWSPSPLAGPYTISGFPYYEDGGTSLSAPIVAGTCALVLDCQDSPVASGDLKRWVLLQGAVAAAPVEDFGTGYLQADSLCSTEIPQLQIVPQFDLSPFRFWHPPPFDLKEILPPEIFSAIVPQWPEARMITVSVANPGKEAVEGAEVELWWSTPTTSFAFPGAWKKIGLYGLTEVRAGGSELEAIDENRVPLPHLLPGGAAIARFAWSLPTVDWNGRLEGDVPCLLARLRAPRSQFQSSWSALPIATHLCVRSVVERQLTMRGAIEIPFSLAGVNATHTLHVIPELLGGTVSIDLPFRALPWRDQAFLKRNGGPWPPWQGTESGPAPSLTAPLSSEQARNITGIEGADFVRLQRGIVSIVLPSGRLSSLLVPQIRVGPRAGPLEVVLRVEGARIDKSRHAVHLVQLSRGNTMGALTLDLRAADR